MIKKKRAGSTKATGKEKATGKDVNKSAAIRDVLKRDPDGKPQAIAQALANQGVQVSAAFVSQVKLKMKNRDEAVAERTSSPPSDAGQFAGSDLLEAKRLIDKLGVEKVREAVELLAKLS